MPLDGQSLSETEIQAIAKWLEEGAAWTISTAAESQSIAQQSFIGELTQWLKVTTRHTKWFFVAGLGLALGILILERRRKRLASQGKSAKVTRGVYYIPILLLLVSAQWWHHRQSSLASENQISNLESQLVMLANPKADNDGDAFGPVPRRPGHPPRLGGEYYRGNDERNPRLFNHGFYRTATFVVSLVDESGNVIHYDSPLPEGPLYLDFQLNRAAGTTDGHYRDGSMRSIYLSRQANNAVAIDEPVPLEEVEPQWKWRARYKLLDEPISKQLEGRVFIHCSASVKDGLVKGHIHYAISYNLVPRDGRLTDESEVWMGSLFQTQNVVATPLDKIPVAEWFDFRPMPEIVGENSDDPALLGIGTPDGIEN